MPIYAYRCESCGHAKDVLQKVSDPLLSTCPACAAETFKKQLTAAGFQLKGSGWYVTDFRGGNSGAAKPDAKPDTAPADGAKPESTPAAAPAPAAASGGDSAPAAGCGTSCACH
jgi:putative FmdB family regulatory protein